nr:o-succinylbenzoate synthase [Mammaliicoccus sp. Marseille-Q6498]
MKQNELNFYTYKANFKIPIQTPLTTLQEREVLIVEWKDKNGQTYYGECNAFSSDWYHFETIQTVKEALQLWFETHKIDDFESYEIACHKINELDKYPNARSAMSMVFFQKFHKLDDVEVDYGATINGNLEQHFKNYNNKLPTRVKLKWHTEIEEDIHYLTDHYPQIKRAIDANGVLNGEDVLLLNQFKDDNFIYIEQPFKDYDKYNKYREQLNLPIFIDESAESIEQIKKFIHAELIDGVVIKPSRVGGIDKALEVIHYCNEHDIKFVVGGMYEFGLSGYFTAYLAQFSHYPSDITPSDYYFDEDFISNPSILNGNKVFYTPPKVELNKLLK